MCHRHAGIPAPETLTPLKLENELQVCGFHPVIQEAIVSDFLKATGKYMHQVATDEFHGSQGNGSFWGPRLFPPGRERDFRIGHGTDPAVGDCNLMRIPPQVLDGIAEAVKGFLYVGAPVFGIEAVFKFLPIIGVTES